MAAEADDLGSVLNRIENEYKAKKTRPSGAQLSRWTNVIIQAMDARTHEKKGFSPAERARVHRLISEFGKLKADGNIPLLLKGKDPNIRKDQWERLSVYLGVIPRGEKLPLVNNIINSFPGEGAGAEEEEKIGVSSSAGAEAAAEGAGAGAEEEGERLIDPSDPRKTVDIINPKMASSAAAPRISTKTMKEIKTAGATITKEMQKIGTEKAGRLSTIFKAAARIISSNRDSTGGVSFMGTRLPASLFKSSMKMNYCGAGTDVVQNVLNGVMPTNKLDAACMEHDFKYYEAGAVSNQKLREALAKKADEELIEDATRIAQEASDDSLRRESEKVAGMMNLKGYLVKRDAFIAQNPPVLSKDKQDQMKNLLAKTSLQALRLAGNPEKLRAPLVVIANEKDFIDVEIWDPLRDPEILAAAGDIPTAEEARAESAAARAGAGAEDAGAEGAGAEGAEGAGAEGAGAGVSETVPVLPPDVERAIIPPQEPERPKVEQEAASMAPIGAPIVGERSMRPMAFKMEGDQVELSTKQEKQNRLWLENFTWIDPGHGLGNQERVPWNLGGGAAVNSLYQAQQKNSILQYGGDLYQGDQYIRKVTPITSSTMRKYRAPMTSTNQREQEFTRNGAMPAGRGRRIQMYRQRAPSQNMTPLDMRNSRKTHLIHGDVVDGKRV